MAAPAVEVDEGVDVAGDRHVATVLAGDRPQRVAGRAATVLRVRAGWLAAAEAGTPPEPASTSWASTVPAATSTASTMPTTARRRR
jgi:hypothetical protein